MESALACFLKSSGSLASYDRNTSSWRTAQTSLLELEAGGLDTFSGSWPRSGMMRNGMSYQLPDLVPPTSESVSGSLLPTPVARSGSTGSPYFLDGGSHARGKLRRLLPTITVNGNYNRVGASPTSGDGLYTILNGVGLKPGSISCHRFAAWMMGFPEDWLLPQQTDLGIRSSLKSLS